jgi:diguanylate cyclase (GGDEF)-like protein/PAS domain S-box-containing protein
MVEDSVADAELCARELDRAGLSFELLRVETRAAFEQALREFGPDLVLSDFTLAGAFDGLVALELARSQLADVPFVFVSGTIGEDRAVEAVKRGATDYVAKNRMQRLAVVVERAIDEARQRAARRRAEQELERTRSQLNGILSNLSDVVWSYCLRENRLIYVNASDEKTVGRAAVDFYIHSERWFGSIHPQDRERVEREWRETRTSGKFDSIYRIVLPGGRTRWIHDRGGVVRDARGVPERVDGIARDITQFKLQEQRIERLNRVYAVLSGINNAIVRIRDRQELLDEACRIAVEDGGFGIAWIGKYDAETGEVTPVASAGLQEHDTLRATKLALRDNAPHSRGLISRMIAERRPVYSNDITAEPGVGGDRRAEAVRRGYRSIIALPLLVEGSLVGNLSLFAREAEFFNEDELKLLTDLAGDVSFALDHIAKDEKLNYLAYFNAITDLPNRTLFNDRLDQRVAAAHHGRKAFSILMIDIARFRQINETLGRHRGDDLLRLVAERLRGALDEADDLAHLGGDFFAIATHHTGEGEALGRLLEQVLPGVSAQPFRLGDDDLRIALRIGVALYPADGPDADSLLRNAEAALKEAKRTGHPYQFYARQMNARVAEHLKLENELRRAILDDQFVLYYQPRFTLAGGRIAGLEALIRWVHGERGLVAPGEFIPLLENTGMILEVGHWALERAALDHAAWRTAGLNPPRVAVNVSAIQLQHKDFVESVRAALSEAADSGRHIDVEITESMLMEDIDGSIEKLKALQAMGVQVAVDDFGTGYSSLTYLTRLPINSLKIDRSFISQMVNGPEQMAVVSAVISLARALNLKVVAEGVETAEQVRYLKLLRCDEAQGYLFGRPMPAAVLERKLRQE